MAILNKAYLHYVLGKRIIPSTPTYQLSQHTLLASGSARECHIHPARPSFCIKVHNQRTENKNLGEQSVIEEYISKALDKHGVPCRHRAQCHGWVNTTRGPGLVVDRIHDTDGSNSRTLSQYVKSNRPSNDFLQLMFNELKEWIFTNNIPLSDFHAENILVRKIENRTELVLIDGIGRGKFRFKLIVYPLWPQYAKWRTLKRWPLFEARFYKDIEACSSPKTRQQEAP